MMSMPELCRNTGSLRADEGDDCARLRATQNLRSEFMSTLWNSGVNVSCTKGIGGEGTVGKQGHGVVFR